MNVPNLLSLIRLLFSPLITYLVLKEHYAFSLTLILFLALTDFLDGFLARKLNQVTKLGKILDPIADKVFTFFAILSYTFLSKEKLNPPIFFLLLGRDLLLVLGGFLLTRRGMVPEPSIFGKLTTFFVSISLITVGILNVYNLSFLKATLSVLEITSIGFILLSWIDYSLKGFKMLLSNERC